MIRPDFPYLDSDPSAWRNRPIPGSVGCPKLAAVGRIISGHGFADAETGDATDGPAWFARIDIPAGETLRNLIDSAREMEPDAPELAGWNPAGWGDSPVFTADDPAAVGGIIYGRDSDGFEIIGAFARAEGFDRAWNRLAGEWAEPESGFALRAAENHGRYRVRRGHGYQIRTAEGFRTVSVCFAILSDCGDSQVIQCDLDYPGFASDFGWRPRGPLGCPCERTDGTVDCPECGKSASEYIAEAAAYIEELADTGIRAEDPGYFDPPDPPCGRMPECTLPDEPRSADD
jgi:hypothetical protein